MKIKKLIIFILFMLSVVSIFLVSHYAKQRTILTLQNEAQSFLETISSNVYLLTNKYAVTATLLAKRKDVIDSLRENGDQQLIIDMLDNSSKFTGAANIWIADASGNIMQTTNIEQVSSNIQKTTYFIAAMEGRLGRQTMLQGLNDRYYIIAAPVYFEEKIIGVIAVQLQLELLEEIWGLSIEPVMVVDEGNRIFSSNVDSWLFQQLTSESEKKKVLMIVYSFNETPQAA